jgi:hypothetical protein
MFWGGLMKRKILTYELAGIVLLVFLGAALHFTFAFSGRNLVVGAFSAVNESVWEHLKLAIWPAILLAGIEFLPLRREANNFWIAKAVAVYFMALLIPVIFYTYTSFITESLAIDLSSFVVTVILGQVVSYKLLTYKKLPAKANWVALALLVLLAVLFVVFTYSPPHLPIFLDPETGLYGIA